MCSGTAPKAGSTRHADCLAAAKLFLPKYSIQQVAEVNQIEFVTISYYYDRAVDARLIGT